MFVVSLPEAAVCSVADLAHESLIYVPHIRILTISEFRLLDRFNREISWGSYVRATQTAAHTSFSTTVSILGEYLVLRHFLYFACFEDITNSFGNTTTAVRGRNHVSFVVDFHQRCFVNGYDHAWRLLFDLPALKSYVEDRLHVRQPNETYVRVHLAQHSPVAGYPAHTP